MQYYDSIKHVTHISLWKLRAGNMHIRLKLCGRITLIHNTLRSIT